MTGIEHRGYLYCTKLRQSKPAGKNSPSCCEPLVEASSANIKINIHVSICLPRCGDGGSLAARGSFRLSLFSSGHPADPSNTYFNDQHLHAYVIQVSAQIVGQEGHPAVMSAEQMGAQGTLTETSHGFKKELPWHLMRDITTRTYGVSVSTEENLVTA